MAKTSRFFALLPIYLFLSYVSFSQEKVQLTPSEFEQAIQQQNVQILDVRTSDEYKAGHIKNSLQADWINKQQFKDRAQHLDKSKPLYVYCASGGRSKAAAEYLRSNGYKAVYELSGGMMKWKAEQKPVEGMPEEKSITLDEFRNKVNASGSPVVLVDFGATWCPPCRKMEPVLQQLQSELTGKFTLIKIDAGAQAALLQELQIQEIPTFVIYKKGKETWRKQGVVTIEELKLSLSAN